MIFQDNVIKEYLKNVYFIAGTPCSGKTTISRELAKRYSLTIYDADEHFARHQQLSNPTFQPSMNKIFKNADEFFSRTVFEYKKWLIDNTREQLDFILLDLIQLSQEKKVLCDCHLTLEEANKLTEPSRIVFLIKEPSNLVYDYCNRPDHYDFRDFINSATDVEKAKALCSETLKSLNEKKYEDIKNSDYFWIEKDNTSTIDETVRKVEQHFDFTRKKLLDKLEIKKVDKDTELVDKLLDFVRNFSWLDVKEHILYMINNWVFTDWETLFVAILDGKIIGMASIMKTDYYPLPEIYPWISSIFVTEDYRGYRISEKLIDYANNYAKENGFEKTYIPTEYIGLYEKYGYQYCKDIINYGNGVDRLYVKKQK